MLLLTDPVQPGLFYKQLCHSLINQVILSLRVFKTISLQNLKSLGAQILREYSSPTLCHMSGVRCQVSGVTSHVSSVTCQVSHVTFLFVKYIYIFLSSFLLFLLFQTKWWSQSVQGCYQCGLPSLVLLDLNKKRYTICFK